MAYLSVTFIAALAIAVSVFSETGSTLFSVLAYAGSGCLVLLLVLAVAALSGGHPRINQSDFVAD